MGTAGSTAVHLPCQKRCAGLIIWHWFFSIALFCASFVFMIPGVLACTYIGYIGKEAATGGGELIKKPCWLWHYNNCYLYSPPD